MMRSARALSATSAIVLAGGDSQRMGADKLQQLAGGRSLLQRAIDAVSAVAGEVVVVGAPDRSLPWLESDARLVMTEDAAAEGGPLEGCLRGLEAASGSLAILVGGDMPLVRPALLALLLDELDAHGAGVAGAVPVHEGVPQVLCSAWRIAPALEAARAARADGERSIRALLARQPVRLLDADRYRDAESGGQSFLSVDTPEDLAQARALLGEG